jgi:hypothetical protein
MNNPDIYVKDLAYQCSARDVCQDRLQVWASSMLLNL